MNKTSSPGKLPLEAWKPGNRLTYSGKDSLIFLRFSD